MCGMWSGGVAAANPVAAVRLRENNRMKGVPQVSTPRQSRRPRSRTTRQQRITEDGCPSAFMSHRAVTFANRAQGSERDA